MTRTILAAVLLLLLVYASRRPGPYWRDRMDVDFGFDR